MLRYTTDRVRAGLVAFYDIWPGTERVNSYNPGTCTGQIVQDGPAYNQCEI